MTEKQKKQARRKFAKEFKDQAVKMVLDEGMTQAEVARDLGVDPNTLNRWVLQYKADGENAFPGKGRMKPQEQKIRDLEKQLKRVTMERDILKKAMAYFAKVPE